MPALRGSPRGPNWWAPSSGSKGASPEERKLSADRRRRATVGVMALMSMASVGLNSGVGIKIAALSSASAVAWGPLYAGDAQAQDSPGQGQVLARHDGVAGRRVAQIMQSGFAQFRIVADRAPARNNVGGRVPPGILREQEGVRVAGAGQRLDDALRGLAKQHGTRASLGIGQSDYAVGMRLAQFLPLQLQRHAGNGQGLLDGRPVHAVCRGGYSAVSNASSAMSPASGQLRPEASNRSRPSATERRATPH